ncbi:MAG TPA: 30S ribosomal protein S6 [Alphaproteobacteria bacterium]|nr:30S ribosomal protein S6 [Alphaproteobacteria bacterium]HAJ45208.1 30S ribosomal protein S6 [Alphaproteobacteria bacterium]
MPFYEHVFIARQDAAQQAVEGLIDELKQVITDNGGQVTKAEYWGVRNLAYKINKNRKGHYALLNIDAPAPAVHELERRQRINEDVIRAVTVRVEALEEGPSAGMIARQARERRDQRWSRREDGDDVGFGDERGDR